MRFSPLVAFLPALVAAQAQQYAFTDQVKGWFDQVKSFIPQTPSNPEAVQHVAQKASAKAAEKATTPITLSNWQSVLEPSTQPEEWLIFITGGNKTCFGRCERAENAFNDSIPLFAADPTSPNLGYLDCEQYPVLCSIWAASAPTVWHLQIPQRLAGEPRPEIPLHVVYVNHTTVRPETIYSIHSEKTWDEKPRYEGWLHPWDGFMAQNGLLVPLGYLIHYIGLIPSWATMIGISFMSRSVMGRRAANPGQLAGRR